MALTVLDAGVLIAILDAEDAHHSSAKDALRRCRDGGDSLVVPASAYAELLVAPYRRGESEVATVDSFLDALPAHVEAISRPIAARAAQLRADHSALRLPDALVIGTALTLQADLLLTTDRRWPRLELRIEVV